LGEYGKPRFGGDLVQVKIAQIMGLKEMAI
jgi:hypothetical protein